MESYKITFKRSAEKELASLPKKDCQKIVEKIKKLSQNFLLVESKKLSGSENWYRIRHGNYRILYEINYDLREIFIFKIGHRREVYR
ncbi:MAG: type II toxin-antitoxin system RelE/ParE family toxin [Verrucomicrobiae bacterium]|nr:type II toxin-antitoxin system RelE/ParE family toxin [Verrucomicrobiae bacterium]